MAAAQGLYGAWIDVYQSAWNDPSSVAHLRCPACGSQSLNLIFVVKEGDDDVGKSIFWCAACLTGLMPMSAPVPPNAVKVDAGQEVVPDYRLVVDDGGA
jgi:hypothetical protein